MLERTYDHLFKNVLPATEEYAESERHLSVAFEKTRDLTKCQIEADTAKRRAANLAVAIDGLADRAARSLGTNPSAIRMSVSELCIIEAVREGCIDRVSAVANAYKHDELVDRKHPIKSDDDVLVVGAGYGVDGYGIPKFGSVQVMVHQTDGRQRKFLGDVPFAIAGWFAFLAQHGVKLPDVGVSVYGFCVHRPSGSGETDTPA